jgi:DNA-binding MarR family transcriptional regulator
MPIGTDLRGLGTQLRHLLDTMERDVAAVGAELALPDYRPRFTPLVRALARHGPSSIRELAGLVGVTHSAASQTVAELARRGLVTLSPGADARQRIVELTEQSRALLPAVETEWRATQAAVAELDAELPMPLGDLLTLLEEALTRRSLRDRMAAHLPGSAR